MEHAILYLGYVMAFLMAFTSMLIELSNKYSSYFQFTLKSYYSYLFCSAYGVVGLLGFWLYQSGVKSIDPSPTEIDNQFLKTMVTAMIVGWSAKGLIDTPLLPAGSKDDSNTEGFRIRVLLNFIFFNADNQFDNIIARKQRVFFDKCTKEFIDGIGDANNADNTKTLFERKVYDFLDSHPQYGDGDASKIAHFNTFMTQFVNETKIEDSFRFAYRNLGYNLFKAIMK